MNRFKLYLSKFSFNTISFATIGAAAILLILGLAYFLQEERQIVAIDDQADRIQELAEEIKRISVQNKEINIQNRNYAYCNAVILAQYTQTHESIQVEDLNECILSTYSEANQSWGAEATENAQGESGAQGSPRSGATPLESTQQSVQSPQATRSPSVGSTQPTPSPSPVTEPTPVAPIPEEKETPNRIITIPGLLELDTPCLDVLGLVKTCN